ncbi:MAG TPA: hypothetical protein VLX92_22130 [Kofleriaceae bacterium]|nr:hypothetical protein [Kofleriaceae bacterium]
MKALVVALLVARTAGATGPCENVGVRYDPPELFDEATQSFAIPASQPWCDVEEHGGALDEVRGEVAFVELRDVSGHVLGTLSTAIGADADHLKAARGAFEAIPYGKLHATLVKRGYAPLVAIGHCKLATTWTDLGPPAGWRTGTLQLDVIAGGKTLVRSKLGDGSVARRGDPIVRAHGLARGGAVAVFAIVPSCAGPPPGYFGPDDGGDCYHVDTPVVIRLEGLAACF